MAKPLGSEPVGNYTDLARLGGRDSHSLPMYVHNCTCAWTQAFFRLLPMPSSILFLFQAPESFWGSRFCLEGSWRAVWVILLGVGRFVKGLGAKK